MEPPADHAAPGRVAPFDRGKNAGLLSTSAKFNDEQRATLKTYMTEVYDVFKGHVTAARGNRLKKPIEELAGGRVFTASA